MKSTKDLIDSFMKQSEHVYVPTGKTTWRLPTGIPSLDKIMGGGIPGGSIVQIYGLETSGKTTLAYHIAGKAIEAGYDTLLVPIEKYSEQYAEACGIDLSQKDNLFHIVSADFAELVFNLCIEAIRNWDTKVIVMDSISAATPKADLEKKQKTDDLEKGANIATQSRAIGDFIRKIQQPVRRKEAIFLTVNQLSNRISNWGTSLKPKGGEQLQYFSDIKIKMKGTADKTKKIVTSTVTIEKGKDWDLVPWGTTDLLIRHASGIDANRDIADTALNAKIITKRGAWYYYGEEKANGMDALTNLIDNNASLREELLEKISTSTVDIYTDEPEEEVVEEDNNGQ